MENSARKLYPAVSINQLTIIITCYKYTNEKNRLICISELPFYNTNEAALIARRGLVSQKSERLVATVPLSFRTSTP